MKLLLALALCALTASPARAQLVALPPPPPPDPAGYQLILDQEVGGGRNYYERFLLHPEWPGAASGVTVGIGYDCGYNAPATIRADWRSTLPTPALDRLAATAGITGRRARDALPRTLTIPWIAAELVFQRVSIAKFWQLCRRTWPGFDALAPPCQWALLSLTFNRGPSMAGPSRTEMRAIRALVPERDYAGIARELRAMPRVWLGRDIYPAMRARRAAEARLVESSL